MLGHVLHSEAPVQNSYALALGDIRRRTFSVTFPWQPGTAVTGAAQTRKAHTLVGNTSHHSLGLTPE